MKQMASRSAAFLLVCALSFSAAGCEPEGEPIIRRIRQGARAEVLDGGAGRLNCRQSALLPGTIALYCFEQEEDFDLLSDSTGAHHATIVGTKTRRVNGPLGLGLALRFTDTNFSTFVEIPDSEAWELEEGQVSFWLMTDTCSGDDQGILSRDARHQQSTGHLTVRLSADCEWSVSSEGDGDRVEVQSIEPLVPDRWAHITINFGPPNLELYLNDKLTGKESVRWGIAGNDNPWVIGADLQGSDEGSAYPPGDFLRGAAVDLLRISSERAAFSDLE